MKRSTITDTTNANNVPFISYPKHELNYTNIAPKPRSLFLGGKAKEKATSLNVAFVG